MPENIMSRSSAVVIAVAAVAGDGLLLSETVHREHAGWLHGIWTDLMFFSDLSNLLVATVFLSVALSLLRERRPWWLGLALVCILLTCVGAQGWRGVLGPVTGNTLVHTWVPLAVAAWCLIFTTKGRLRWKFLLTWSLVPIGYLTYALGRGAVTSVYPYPWLNPARVGMKVVLLNAALQIVTYIALAALLLVADRFWPQPRERAH